MARGSLQTAKHRVRTRCPPLRLLRYHAGMRFSLLLLFCAALACPAFAGNSKKEQASAGARLFANSGCAHCHGDKLEGNDVGPSLRGVGRQLKPEAIKKQIHDGGKVMPAFGDVLSGGQIDQLVVYLRTQRARVPEPKPASAQGRSPGEQ